MSRSPSCYCNNSLHPDRSALEAVEEAIQEVRTRLLALTGKDEAVLDDIYDYTDKLLEKVAYDNQPRVDVITNEEESRKNQNKPETEARAEEEARAEPEPEAGGNAGLVVGIVVPLLILIIVAVIFVLWRLTKKEKKGLENVEDKLEERITMNPTPMMDNPEEIVVEAEINATPPTALAVEDN